ncbi:MAG: hypothetical protein AMJ60_04885 [Desulfobacterales bacterium SG8_35]|nr:MAG: hypothetical protein AMJ60_04885 [Desulfobacterales bacterium SG8_35]
MGLFAQPSTAEKAGSARGLFESALSGRVSQRPADSRSTGKSAKSGPSDRLPFLLIRFLWASKENEYKIMITWYPDIILLVKRIK